MRYPNNWTISNDNGTYLFLDNNNWNGNFRVSANKITNGTLEEREHEVLTQLEHELSNRSNSKRVTIGGKKAVYDEYIIQEDGKELLMRFWIVGIQDLVLVCSFAIDAERASEHSVIKELEEVIKAIESISIIKNAM
jgi:hypothetical protein